MDDAFPREPIEALGYNVVTHGQKTFNGVALLSKYRFDETTPRLGGDPDDLHARFLEGVVSYPNGSLRIACLYLPNGNPPETEKYPYKIKWMERLLDYTKERMKGEQPLVHSGDFNVIPANGDVYNPAAWAGDALFLPKTRERFRALLNLGLTDAIRAVNDQPGQYVLGLSGGCMAEEQRHPDRPPAAVTAGQRPAAGRRHRPSRQRLGKGVRSCSGVD
jgi:exodeoxyribonuclease-3